MGRELRLVGRELEWRDVPTPSFAVRLGGRKLIRYADGDGFRYEYFDLRRDPGERTNRYDPSNPKAEELRRLLEAYVDGNEKEHARLRGGEASTAGETALDPERIEKLRALGYLE